MRRGVEDRHVADRLAPDLARVFRPIRLDVEARAHADHRQRVLDHPADLHRLLGHVLRRADDELVRGTRLREQRLRLVDIPRDRRDARGGMAEMEGADDRRGAHAQTVEQLIDDALRVDGVIHRQPCARIGEETLGAVQVEHDGERVRCTAPLQTRIEIEPPRRAFQIQCRVDDAGRDRGAALIGIGDGIGDDA